ncbi:MAG TPA: hypothetical protein VGE78_10880 [Agromyces sp.]
MTTATPATTETDTLARGRLGTFDIVFFVVSAAAPLTVAVSSAPLAFLVGGVGAPGAMLASGVVLILFAIGFTAMSRFVRNTGAFYAYAAAGLGKPVGIGVAFVTIVAYAFLCICFYALLGFYANLTFAELLGIDLPWGVWSVVSVLVIGYLGYRRIDVGAKVLAVLLSAEIAILLVISLAIIFQNGGTIGEATAASFDPKNVFFATGASALFVFGFGAFLGFEGTVIYAEEAKEPQRTVPRATYIAIAFLGIFYAFTFWALTVLCLLAVLAGALSGADPFLGLGLWTYAIGVAGLIFAQGVAAVSVIGFFWKDRRGFGVWRVLVAPVLGAVGLLVAFIVIVANFDLVSGFTDPVVTWALIGCVPVVFIAGIVIGLVMKRRSPERYAALTQSVTVVEPENVEVR